ncbi:MAG TPA: amino acid adenylation domain-containing protein, partial [Mucilaginibacter sp.]
EYCTDLYRAETIDRMISHYINLLGSIVSLPASQVGRLSMLSESEEEQLLVEFNATAADYAKDNSIVDLFEEQAAKTPNATAVVFEEAQLTYKELNERSNRLARYLQKKGVKAETPVPICLERSAEMIIGILGILKAGGAYVPVDPDYPSDRISYMLEDTGAKLVLSSTASRERLNGTTQVSVIELDGDREQIEKEKGSNLQTGIRPEQLAYVIYTSGSTGKPKGAMNEHRGIVNRLLWAQDYFKLNSQDAILQKTTFCFDVSAWELLWPLIAGARLVFAKPGGQADSAYLRSVIESQKITLLHFVPPMLSAFVSDLEAGDCRGLKNVLCSGEALSPSQVQLFEEKLPEVKLHNLYGPTEAAIDVTCWSYLNKAEAIGTVPIGKPVSNTQIHILDINGRLVPAGVPGEIHIGGVQVGRGYLNNEELTAEKFISDPFSKEAGARLYRTGDLGRWLPDGNIEYLGRTDDQVKIRGYRIELGEIESVLNQSGLVSQAVVLARADSGGNKRLAGYIVPKETFDKQAVQNYLRAKLPEYMVPALWVELERIPLTPNGKTDRRALPDAEAASKREYIAPRTAAEALMAEIWQEVLKVDKIGIEDNFFELGGHSLLALRLGSSIRKRFGSELPISEVFVYPTVSSLTNQLESKNKLASQLLLPIKITGNKMPLYIICGAGGTVFKFVDFVKLLDPEQPVYGLQQPSDGADMETFPNTIEGIAEMYLKEILKQNPHGPYALSGHCLGGNIAFEMAIQLKKMGKQVAMLGMLDASAMEEEEVIPATFNNYYHIPGFIKNFFSAVLLKIKFEIFLLLKHPKQALLYKIEKVKSIMGISEPTPEDIEMESFRKVSKVFETAIRNYKMKHYEGEVLVFYAKEHFYFVDRNKRIIYKRMFINNDTKNAWKKYAKSVKIYEIDGEHSTIFNPKYASGLAKIIQTHLDTNDNQEVIN